MGALEDCGLQRRAASNVIDATAIKPPPGSMALASRAETPSPTQARVGTRTRGLFLTKEVLCRLSYASMPKTPTPRNQPCADAVPDALANETALTMRRRRSR